MSPTIILSSVVGQLQCFGAPPSSPSSSNALFRFLWFSFSWRPKIDSRLPIRELLTHQTHAKRAAPARGVRHYPVWRTRFQIFRILTCIRGFSSYSWILGGFRWILLGFLDSPWIRGFSLDSGGFSFDSWIPVDSELYFGVDSELMQVCVVQGLNAWISGTGNDDGPAYQYQIELLSLLILPVLYHITCNCITYTAILL